MFSIMFSGCFQGCSRVFPGCCVIEGLYMFANDDPTDPRSDPGSVLNVVLYPSCQGVNPDMKYEVQYSSYVNVTSDGFVVLKRVVKTESFALQVNEQQNPVQFYPIQFYHGGVVYGF